MIARKILDAVNEYQCPATSTGVGTALAEIPTFQENQVAELY